MVVQSIALPKVAGGLREQEISVVTADVAAVPVGVVHDSHGRSFHAPVLVPLLVATQAAWLGLLGYGVFRLLLG
jgi:hypothetical protein